MRDIENRRKWGRENYAENRNRIAAYRKNWHAKDPRKQMIASAKVRAKRDRVPFELLPTDFEIPKECPVFHCPFEFGTRTNHRWAPTLDKVIPTLGYVKGNVQIISHRANMLKGNATLLELKQLITFLENMNAF